MHPGPCSEQNQRNGDYGKRHIFLYHRDPEFAERDESTDKHKAKDYILCKALDMRQMRNIPEASAVHFRIENDKDDCQKRKESLHCERSNGSNLSPYSCHEGRT